MSEHDKEYDFLLKFILHEVLVTGTVDKIHLLVISENEVELLTNVLPWTRVELANGVQGKTLVSNSTSFSDITSQHRSINLFWILLFLVVKLNVVSQVQLELR